MCGIVGYIGHRNAEEVLMHGLERLEYRGYDSSGIAVMDHHSIRLIKAEGRLSNLAAKLKDSPLTGTSGIGHTRWATHGEPSDLNAHPHTDMKGDIAIVHNGIIENHAALRAALQSRGCVFVSDTDTEVIVHLLHSLYDGDMIRTIRQAQSMLEGSYALGILSTSEPDRLYCTRKDSPLVLGLSDHEHFVASDIPALIAYTRRIELLQDKEIAVLSRDDVTILDPYGRERPSSPIQIDWDIEAAEKGGYAHFMLKEIHEEPDALRKTFTAHVDAASFSLRPDAFPISPEAACAMKGLVIVACGTAYHAGMIGKYVIETLAKLPVTVDLASEFRYRQPILSSGHYVLAISQSGETADTLAALREAHRLGAHTLALTNVIGSSITREAESGVMYTYAGPEIAVASTKAYITQVEMMLLLAIDLALKRGAIDTTAAADLLRQLSKLPDAAEHVLTLSSDIQRFASQHYDRRQVFYIGRGLDYALALEASLKLKEISYIMSEAYAAGELKHGTIALIEPGTLVCALLTQPHLADKMLSNIRETRSRGAHTLIICTEELKAKASSEADVLWTIPDAHPLFTPLLAVIPVQLLAYAIAVSRGCDVDKPRNLAKSVTVE